MNKNRKKNERIDEIMLPDASREVGWSSGPPAIVVSSSNTLFLFDNLRLGIAKELIVIIKRKKKAYRKKKKINLEFESFFIYLYN